MYSFIYLNNVFINNVILQKVKFHATSKSRSESKIVACLRRDAIEAHSSDSYSNVPMLIPPLPPSGLRGCRIIDIEYTLTVSIELDSVLVFSAYMCKHVIKYEWSIKITVDFKVI